jgi:hypothetical protein
MILMTLPPWLLGLLPPLVMAALLPLLIRGANLLYGWGCGWKSVLERFPARELQKSGDTYTGQTGGIVRGQGGYSLRRLKVGVVPSGIYLYPSFARRSPCFIPWSSIRSAGVRGASIDVTVEESFNYSQALRVRDFNFTLPIQTLRVLEANLAPDKIHHLPPVSAVLGGLVGLGVKAIARKARGTEQKRKQ